MSALSNMSCIVFTLLTLNYVFMLFKGQVALYLFFQNSILFKSSYDFSGFTIFNKIASLITAMVCLISSKNYFEEKRFYYFESVVLTSTILLGAFIMISAQDLLLFYIAVELISLSLYVFISMKKNENQALESALKYFILGAIASAMIVFGAAFLYSIGITTNLAKISTMVPHLEGNIKHRFYIGCIFILIGVFYKLAVFPFHYWIGDVYVGAPSPVVMQMATLAKYPFMVFLIKFDHFLLQGSSFFQYFLLIAGTMSIIIGSFYAYGQLKVKRLMAYSSTVHSGFMILAISTNSLHGYIAALLYNIIYILLSLAFFNFFLSNFRGRDKKMFLYLSDFKDLAKFRPGLAFLVTIVMFSYVGIPPLIGFFGKYLVLLSLAEHFRYTFVILISGLTILGSLYYFRFIKNIHFNLKESAFYEPIFSWKNNRLGYIVFIVNILVLIFGWLYIGALERALDILLLVSIEV